MKAVTHHGYGPPEVLRLQEVDRLVRVHAADVAHIMRGEAYLGRLAFGLDKPKRPTLGLDMAGTVVATGNGVITFKHIGPAARLS